MANDLFRRLVMFSPEITQDAQNNGAISLPTMKSIVGNSNQATNPQEALSIKSRMDAANQYGIFDHSGAGTQMGQGSGMYDSPQFFKNFSTSNLVKTGARFVTEMTGQVANLKVGPWAKPVLDYVLDSSGISNMMSNDVQLGPSPFLPESLGGTGEAGFNSMFDDDDEFNMTAPENLRNMGPAGQRATSLGTYRGQASRGGRGFVVGQMDLSSIQPQSVQRKGPSDLDKRMQNIRR